jgi:HEAT repeat protein
MIMNNQQVLADLKSSDWYRVTSSLSRLGAEKQSLPSEEVFRQMIDLISEADGEVRRLAIFAVGLHWQHLPAVPEIIKALDDFNENPEVTSCAISALGTIGHNAEPARDQILHELARIVRSDSVPDELRGEAYTAALWAARRISADECARRPLTEDLNDVDWAWLKTL